MPNKIKVFRPRNAPTRQQQKRLTQRQRVAREPWRKWYNLACWRRLRALVLDRDPYCVRCERRNVATPSTVANHIKPHRGDADLFWNAANLEGVCAGCHNGVIQSEEARNR